MHVPNQVLDDFKKHDSENNVSFSLCDGRKVTQNVKTIRDGVPLCFRFLGGMNKVRFTRLLFKLFS